MLFDGLCNLCDAWVLFVIDRDPQGAIAFAPLQSAPAQRMLNERGYRAAFNDSPGNPSGTILLIEGKRIFDRSTAVLRIVRRLSGLWPALSALALVPRPLRDWLYDFVARRRYRWFGRRQECRIPTAELERRFVG